MFVRSAETPIVFEQPVCLKSIYHVTVHPKSHVVSFIYSARPERPIGLIPQIGRP